ncbi:MAG: DUF1801 domain-containing protein [Flavobacteriaceae bacterium]|nr:DUF1801 domain-containing protein [Bacteroidia bacterium]MBT8288872.1 DUF1801 domain-containing protein [Bacteroidia bacterium]NNF74395.1 DUF1801 domain-containing protein [Flavobacteriaceae bacterium]NNK72556.1 DUF1801 domain-containing protein [Flavobacteriaceae bacterium]
MQYKANTPDEYINQIPEERQAVMQKLRQVIKGNLPDGFEETMGYGMIGYVVPHRIYPDGYHCDPKLPLPFMSIASQKNFVAVYHMGIYADEELLKWFTSEYPKYCSRKLDMGKSCIRFKKIDDIPYELIGTLSARVTPAEWIETYESQIKKK